MAQIKIRGQTVDVDIVGEVSNYEWIRPKFTQDKLICASPFREERTPSFFLNLDGDYAGTWGDAGAFDSEWASGNLAKLLSFLRNETMEETEDYLLATYSYDSSGETVKLAPIRLRLQRNRQTLKPDYMQQFSQDNTYLLSRGISANVQRQMGVGYDRTSRAVVIPWRLPDGRLANAKFRQTRGKVFWYQREAWPIRELVYGIDQAQATTVLCEAEIDAMSFIEAGYAAIAVGGASFNDYKRDMILRSPVETMVIATDNDKAGEKLRKEVERSLAGKITLRHAYVPSEAKDANEALVKYGAGALVKAVEQSESCQSLYVNLRTISRGR